MIIADWDFVDLAIGDIIATVNFNNIKLEANIGVEEIFESKGSSFDERFIVPKISTMRNRSSLRIDLLEENDWKTLQIEHPFIFDAILHNDLDFLIMVYEGNYPLARLKNEVDSGEAWLYFLLHYNIDFRIRNKLMPRRNQIGKEKRMKEFFSLFTTKKQWKMLNEEGIYIEYLSASTRNFIWVERHNHAIKHNQINIQHTLVEDINHDYLTLAEEEQILFLEVCRMLNCGITINTSTIRDISITPNFQNTLDILVNLHKKIGLIDNNPRTLKNFILDIRRIAVNSNHIPCTDRIDSELIKAIKGESIYPNIEELKKNITIFQPIGLTSIYDLEQRIERLAAIFQVDKELNPFFWVSKPKRLTSSQKHIIRELINNNKIKLEYNDLFTLIRDLRLDPYTQDIIPEEYIKSIASNFLSVEDFFDYHEKYIANK